MSDSIRDRIRRRLDAEAIEQLRAEVTRLAAENDQLRTALADANYDADRFYGDWLQAHLDLCEATDGTPALTQDGRLAVIQEGVH